MSQGQMRHDRALIQHASNRGQVQDLLLLSTSQSIQVFRAPRDSKTHPQIDSPRCPSISSTKLRGNCFLAALTFSGFMVAPVSACPNVPRNAVDYRLYHTNRICCVLHDRHRSAHAGYRVSHLAWPSVRALDMNVSIVVRHQLCINQANRSTGRRRLG